MKNVTLAVLAVMTASIALAAEKPWFMNVVPAWGGDEIRFSIDEMIRQKREVGLDTFIPSLSFHPQTSPAKDLIPVLCSRFREMKAGVAGKGITLGVLVQSVLGHGWNGKVPLTDEKWKHVVKADGEVSPRFCSLDPGFRAYTYDAIGALAQEKPAFILVDDDVGIRAGECFCPLHMARINAALGKSYTREELKKIYDSRPLSDPEIVAANRVLGETIVEYGRDVIRKAIDSVDPAMRCGICACWPGYWQMNDLAHALAGRTKPFVRVNDAVYGDSPARDIVFAFYGATAVMHHMDDDVEMIDEADTFPHSVMSESATMFHAHLTTALLNGLVGAKLWTSEFQEPVALGTQARYEARLRDYAGFYAKLREMADGGIAWKGACRPLVRPPAGFGGHPSRTPEGIYPTQWNTPLEAVFALPVRREGVEKGGLVMLRAEDVERMTDADLRRVLSGRALVDSLAARALTARGFSALMGVKAGSGGPDFHFTCEWAADGSHSIGHMWDDTTSELAALDDKAVVTWNFCQGPRLPQPRPFAPSVVRYRNELGGKVVTLGWSLDLVYHKALRPVRKIQLLAELDWLNGVPLEAVGLSGDQALVRHGVTKSGEEFIAYISLAYEILPKLDLRMSRMPRAVERLSPTGKWEPVRFVSRDAACVSVDVRVDPLEPIVLKIVRADNENTK